MSPKAERAPEGQEAKLGFKYFTVDLTSPEAFDPFLFDKLAKKTLTSKLDNKLGKYIAVDNTMYIFDYGQKHSMVYETFKKMGIGGELKSAGSIFLIWPEDEATPLQRQVTGRSLSLDRELSLVKSDEYKNTVLKKKLGKFFKID